MKQQRLLKLSINNIGMFENNCFEVDFVNRMNVKNYNEDSSFYNIFNTVYLPKYLMIAGINASGKSTGLELISELIYFYFCEVGLNSDKIKVIKNLYIGEPMHLKIHYVFDASIYYVETVIAKDDCKDDNSSELLVEKVESDSFKIIDEKISSKKITKSINKLNLYKNFSLIHDRKSLPDETKTFLKNDESISRIVKGNHKLGVFLTLSNDIPTMEYFEQESFRNIEDIQYLDPSIKEITPFTLNFKLDMAENLEDKNLENNFNFKNSFSKKRIMTYKVDFFNGETKEMTIKQLVSILSSGTIRGLIILKKIRHVLRFGGYLVVDELEVNLNNSILTDIIQLFENKNTNPLNATIIFTTHYIELLNNIGRNDQIIYAYRNHNFEMNWINYSNIAERNDLKRSEAYFSDYFEIGTAIKYQKYLAFLDSFTNEGAKHVVEK